MKFPEKLWKIVNECTSGAIGWGIDGDRIFVDYDKFELEYLGKDSGFKTKNIVSFVRQLNLYGFRKCSRYNDVHEFKHRYFVRGRKELLKLVNRNLGYNAKIAAASNADKLEMQAELQEQKEYVWNDARTEHKTPTPVESSSMYNIFWNQMHYYNSMYSDWMRRNALCAMNGGRIALDDSPTPTKTEACDNLLHPEGQNSNLENYNRNRNFIYVPVPAQYFCSPGSFNSSMSLSFNGESQSEDVLNNNNINSNKPLME